MKETITSLFLILSFTTGFCQSHKLLQIENTVDTIIELGEVHHYNVELEANRHALLSIKQNGIDVVIKTYSSNGQLIDSFDSPNGEQGDEIVVLDAQESGIYKIRILPLGETSSTRIGKYKLTFIAENSDIKLHLDQCLELLNQRNGIPGFSVGIVSADEIFFEQGYGYSNILEKKEFTSNTIQCIASISKTFIGLSLMMLQEAGQLTLDQPINDFLPFRVINPHYPEEAITLRHLATHTSGINEDCFYEKSYIVQEQNKEKRPKYTKSFKKDLRAARKNIWQSMDQYLMDHLSVDGNHFRKRNFFKARPGTKWYYSNTGAALAALIVQVVSKTSYDDYVMDHIVQPLNLMNTHWTSRALLDPNTSRQYDQFKNILPNRSSITYPDGSLYMNIKDLNRYLQFYISKTQKSNKIISHHLVKEMMMTHFEETEGKYKGIKNGIFWWNMKNGTSGHSGGDSGTSAHMFFDPKNKVGYTMLCNMMPLETDRTNAQSRSIRKLLIRYMHQMSNVKIQRK